MVDQTTSDVPKDRGSRPPTSSHGSHSGFLGSIEKGYENLIERGKRKLGYYHPDVSESDRFLMSFLIYFTVLLMVVFTADYLAQKMYEDSDSLGPLQYLEVEIVYTVQKDYFDMPVWVNRTSNTIWYDTNAEWRGQTLTQEEKIGGFGLEIASVCTGFHEMVFLGVLVLGFRGVPVKLRLKWTVILLSIVFVENLFRIFALYPLALYYGRDWMEWFHFYWWHYGQYAFIMGLFGLWFIFVARKYVNPDEYIEAERKREMQKEKMETVDRLSQGKRSKSTREKIFRKRREGLSSSNVKSELQGSGTDHTAETGSIPFERDGDLVPLTTEEEPTMVDGLLEDENPTEEGPRSEAYTPVHISDDTPQNQPHHKPLRSKKDFDELWNDWQEKLDDIL